MRAGKLRHPIGIFAASSTRDAYGQQLVSSPVLVLRTRAAIAAIAGKDVYALGAGYAGQVTHKITIRYPEVTLTGGMTVQFRQRQFLVQFTQDPDEMRRELDLISLEQGDGRSAP